MTGKINSVAAQLKKKNLFMTSVHCIAHRHHLAGQVVAKEVLFSVIDALNDDAINAEYPKDRIRATQLINNLDTEFNVHFIKDDQNISTRLYTVDLSELKHSLETTISTIKA
ncbi:hypothetical protein RhiirC2_785679 [Rhizophagus irregularis]|uniref:Uncharacterized protein n=1 Tax=Rhizophagus irregularis TaxID=588596 RepID=A0A2N1MVW5_9GLOM|nr:hypothetical protein RhiirC2_785679 [Rhizophagus irregularis]